jgi:hypothetical protein
VASASGSGSVAAAAAASSAASSGKSGTEVAAAAAAASASASRLRRDNGHGHGSWGDGGGDHEGCAISDSFWYHEEPNHSSHYNWKAEPGSYFESFCKHKDWYKTSGGWAHEDHRPKGCYVSVARC